LIIQQNTTNNSTMTTSMLWTENLHF